jgi:hypothetical protein
MAMEDETFDYGLEPGESFIPDDIDDIDATAPHIMTVLGPVLPGALGATNAAALLAGSGLPAGDALLNELEEAGYVGLGAFVSCDVIGDAAALAPLRWLAERANQHLIYGYTMPSLPEFDAELQAVVEVALHGLGEYAAQPGFIAARWEQLSVATVAREATGLPIVVQLSALEVDTLLSAAPDELDGVIARIDGTVALDRLQALAEAGAFLLIDQLSGDREQDRPLAESVAQLAESGWLQSLLLGYHPQSAPESVSYGVGSRWSYLIEQFPLLVLDAGLDALAMRTILIDNPNEALTIHPPYTPG